MWRRSALAAAVLVPAVIITASIAPADVPESAFAGWPRQFGSPGEDYVRTAASTGSGDVFVGGGTSGQFPTFTTITGTDGWIAKLDRYGRLKWLKQFSTPDWDSVEAIAVSGNSLYVAGYTVGAVAGGTSQGQEDAYVARLDLSGRLRWIRQFGTAGGESPKSITVSGGRIYLAGDTTGAFPGTSRTGTDTDTFVAVYDTQGRFKSVRQFGTDKDEYLDAMTMTGNRMFLVGDTYGAFPTYSNAAGDQNGFVARIDTTGSLKWVRQFTGLSASSASSATAVSVSGNGVFIAGNGTGTLEGFSSVGNWDAYVARYDFAGNRQWLRQFGTSGFDVAHDVKARSGRIYVVGATSAAFPGFTTAGPGDGFLARFDTTGNPGSIRQFGTSSDDTVKTLVLRRNDYFGGAVVMLGTTYGTVWGQVAAGAEDVFISTALG